MTTKIPTILITNDDGITAPGIRALVQAAQEFGNVVVVAPDSPQSGMGHAITIGSPLRLNKVDVFEGVDSWQCSGTPADCVKLAKDKILHNLPDICLSGINHGANHSINVIYSGTMSAAMEAAIEGVPSVGFSLLDYKFEANFDLAQQVVKDVLRRILQQKLPAHFLLNVNIPRVNATDYKGLKICRQAYAKWDESFDHRKDPYGKDYYWMTGKFINLDDKQDTDVLALEEGYASVVPIKIDFTDYATKTWLAGQWPDVPEAL